MYGSVVYVRLCASFRQALARCETALAPTKPLLNYPIHPISVNSLAVPLVESLPINAYIYASLYLNQHITHTIILMFALSNADPLP